MWLEPSEQRECELGADDKEVARDRPCDVRTLAFTLRVKVT